MQHTIRINHLRDSFLRLYSFRIVKERGRSNSSKKTKYKHLSELLIFRFSREPAATLLLVEPGGIEPPTPCLQSRCSPS
jgi:hypothetical protein